MTTLEKAREEISSIEISGQIDINTSFVRTSEQVKNMALEIIDKYAEQEPCDDVVSRQAVLDVIERGQFKGDAISEIEKLPSVRPQEPEIVKYGWTKIPKCTTCKYWYSPIVPCSRCKDNSEFKPRESDEISERNMKMWEELFKAEREDKK